LSARARGSFAALTRTITAVVVSVAELNDLSESQAVAVEILNLKLTRSPSLVNGTLMNLLQ
jgi:hypothetical protein